MNQVIPSEYGVKRKPWFLFSPSYWCGGAQPAPRQTPLALVVCEQPQNNPPTNGAYAGEEKAGVRTGGLRKVYPRGVAVHGLDLEIEGVGQVPVCPLAEVAEGQHPVVLVSLGGEAAQVEEALFLVTVQPLGPELRQRFLLLLQGPTCALFGFRGDGPARTAATTTGC